MDGTHVINLYGTDPSNPYGDQTGDGTLKINDYANDVSGKTALTATLTWPHPNENETNYTWDMQGYGEPGVSTLTYEIRMEQTIQDKKYMKLILMRRLGTSDDRFNSIWTGYVWDEVDKRTKTGTEAVSEMYVVFGRDA